MNKDFEELYDRTFLPLYEKNIKPHRINTHNTSHIYSISEKDRKNLFHLEVYSIDPEGSVDADDAFSIEKDCLYIHIADPTEHISLKSDLWKQISNQIVTRYPSNRKPLHLMPEHIVKLCSLQGESASKNAITVQIQIKVEEDESYQLIGIYPSLIQVKKGNAYSYKKASVSNIFKKGLELASHLRERRGENALKLSVVSNAYPVYDSERGEIKLYKDTKEEIEMKQMIAEFAIIANQMVAEFIQNNVKLNNNIFRTCSLSEGEKQDIKGKNGSEIIEYIVSNGVKASYDPIQPKHDLVGIEHYTHFTSPLRRASDCVCHYILKYLFIRKNIQFPFSNDYLTKIGNKCNEVTKQIKKIQYDDNKFRLIQTMSNRLYYKFYDNMYSPSRIEIQFKLRSYSGLFLNINVIQIDEYPVYLTMVFRKKFLDSEKINKNIQDNQIYKIDVTNVPFTESRFDSDKVPELFEYLNNAFSL